MSKKKRRYPNELRQYAIRLSKIPHADLRKIADKLEIPSWQMKVWLEEEADVITRRQDYRFEMSSIQERYGTLLDELVRTMRRHDTEGLSDAPEDEYEPEARRVLNGLDKVKNATDMRQLVKSIFFEMFDEALYATEEQLFSLADDLWTHCRAYCGEDV
jgi:transposase-like protein